MMLKFLKIPIQGRIRRAILLSSVVTLFLSSVALVGWQWGDARDRTRGFLKTEAEILADSSAAALMFEDRVGAEQVLASLRAQPHVLGAELHGMDGRVLARFGAGGVQDASPVAVLAEEFTQEGRVLELVQGVMEEGRRIGYLRLRYDFAALRWEVLRPLIWIVGVVFFAAVGLAVVLADRLQRWIAQPILHLTSVAQAVAERKDFSVRAPELGGDDLGTLARAFNRMLERIHEQDAALRESEERFRGLFENATIGMYQTSPDHRLLLANPALMRMMGYPSVDAVNAGRGVLGGYQDPAEAARFRELMEREGQVLGWESEWRRLDGSRIAVRESARLVRDVAGGILCFEGTVEDITERKRAEEELVRAFDVLEEKVRGRTRELTEAKTAAEAASAAKSRFLAMMSHEIRTPLNGVTGVLHLLERDSATARQQRWIRMALASGDTLLRVINDVLDFSKIEAGKLEIRREAVEFRRMLTRASAPHATRAVERGLGWVEEIDPALPGWVASDADRLTQVLGNLLGNAIKFTPSGGIRLRAVRLPVLQDGGAGLRVRFEVVDTGIGIPEEHQGRLFQPFAQVDDSNSRPFGGTGLGLGICRQLVELMGGRIGMISEAGCGSTFWFELPFDLAEPPSADDRERDTPSAERTGGGLVLIADDNEINLEMARELIRSLGYSCEVVLEGRAAVRAVTEGAYDLVMMDCMMPGIDGYEATRAIRRAEGVCRQAGGTRRVPIVAMTANAMKGDREKCLAAGMDDYVSKPLDPEEIARVLRQWVSPQSGRAVGVGDGIAGR